jgi:hypothetical protein
MAMAKKERYDDFHASILFAATPAIENYYTLSATLGQRILFMRPQNDRDKAVEQAEKNQETIKRKSGPRFTRP